MTAKRKSGRQSGVPDGNKRRPPSDILRPGVGGLPPKPVFSQNDAKISRHNNATCSSAAGNTANTNPIVVNDNTGAFELFPGVKVNLPKEDITSNRATQTACPNTAQPTADALQIFSSILGTLQSTSQQHQQQQHYPQQYSYPPQYNPSPYSSPAPQSYGQNPNFQYQYPTVYNQSVYPNYTQQVQATHSVPPNFDATSHQNNALVSMFSQLLESYSSSSHQPISTSTDAYKSEKANYQKTKASPKTAKPDSGKSKKVASSKDANNQADSDDDFFIDEEAELEKSVAVQGTNIVLENEEDIQKWIEERKKNWPTNQRVEEKRKELEKAKIIVENLNNNAQSNDKEKPKIRMCNFWIRTKKCRNGQNCKFSHDMSNYTKPKHANNKAKSLSTKPLPNHKVKLVHGIPVHIPSRFTPLNNEGKSLHNLLMEGERFQNENVKLLGVFSKMVKNGIIKQDWNELKKRLKLDDKSLISN